MPLATGLHLGPYEIVAQLGAGGMGEVYHARDLCLGRAVAIKVLAERLADDARMLARFEQDAVAALTHPNILDIHDVGTDQGIAYAVMELLEGKSLKDALAAGPFPWQQALAVARGVAGGLAAAHARGIVHRDLKPANLFLTEDGQIKVLDFGLAHIEPPASPPASPSADTDTRNETSPYVPPLTEEGMVMGTPAYMSPEQVRGQAVDARSDIFSFGCVLYEMLSGRQAFKAPTRADLVAAILQHEPPPLPAHIPAPLGQVIQRCLAKDPANRYASGQDLVAALRTLSESPPQRWNGWAAIGGAAAVLVVIVGFAAFIASRRQPAPRPNGDSPRPIEAVAVLPFENVGKKTNTEFLSDGISESITHNLAAVRALKVRPFSSAMVYRGDNLDIDKVKRDLKVEAIVRGRVSQHGDVLQISVELIDVRGDEHQLWGKSYSGPAEKLLATQEDIARQVTQKLELHLTGAEQARLAKRPTEDIEAYKLYIQGRHLLNNGVKEKEVRTAIDLFLQATRRDPRFALAHAAEAEAHYWLSNQYLSPRDAIPPAKKAVLKALAADEELGEAHAFHGLFLSVFDWDWKAAEAAYARARMLSPGSAIVHVYHGMFLVQQGRLKEALPLLREAVELDPSSMLVAAYSAFFHYLSGEHEEAVRRLEALRKSDDKNMLVHAFLGLVYEARGDYPAAIQAFEAARANGCPSEGIAQLGHAYAMHGRTADAKQILKELAAYKGYVSPYNVALLYAALGDKDRAFEEFRKAGDDRSEWYANLKVDPRLNPLRTDPRFAELLRRANLAP